MNSAVGRDRSGHEVRVGNRVRLLAIRPSILERVAGNAAYQDVSAMLGQVADVFDVYDTGLVWVSATFPRVDGTTEIHAIAVDPESIELVLEE